MFTSSAVDNASSPALARGLWKNSVESRLLQYVNNAAVASKNFSLSNFILFLASCCVILIIIDTLDMQNALYYVSSVKKWLFSAQFAVKHARCFRGSPTAAIRLDFYILRSFVREKCAITGEYVVVYNTIMAYILVFDCKNLITVTH
jgi:hypothetical protein